MPFGTIAGIAGQGLGAFKQNKLQKVASGTKTIKKPKTKFGKLFGKITGRNEAFELQEQIKQENNMQIRQAKQSVVSGALQFGKQQNQANLPIIGLVGAFIVAIVYFVTGRKKTRRR